MPNAILKFLDPHMYCFYFAVSVAKGLKYQPRCSCADFCLFPVCVCVHMCLLILSFCLFTTEITCLATSESNCILKSGVQWGRVLAWLGALQLWRRLLPWPNRKSHANGCFFLGGMLIFSLFLHLSFLYYPKCDWRYVCKIFMVWKSNILI